jgi:hypothetical protein
MKNFVHLIQLLPIILLTSCGEKPFLIDKNNVNSIAIVIPDSASSIAHFAADELKKHLDLVFGGDIKIYPSSANNKSKEKFFIGIKPDGYEKTLNPEEAVYLIRKNNIFLFGDDIIDMSYSDDKNGELKNRINSEVLNLSYNRTGTLFAVYSFLENELGIKWIKPGDQGIFYTKMESASLPVKVYSWTPSLIQRNIRTDSFTYNEQVLYGKYAPKEFQMTESDAIRKHTEVLTWMRRMRMGRSENFRFGHAYTSYWDKYKNSNPDIFALNGKGERKPMGRIERVKMCPTNPDLPKIIVDEWKESFRKNPLQNRKSISGCENDGDGFGNDEWCHCDKCMAIDIRKDGEDLTSYATDRYIYLWNAVLKEARKIKSDIVVSGYAYANMLKPPRRIKLDDGIIIEFIPRMGGDFKKTQEMYTGWREAGMRTMMYRPNDMNWEIGIPFGQEERLFNNYKLAISNNAVGTDFDSMLGFWDGMSDMAYYILTKGHVDPTSSFETLENEYLSCFGEAKEDISKYYRHWRNIFNNKILTEELRLNDGVETYFLEWALLSRLTARIDDFYSIEDFDVTDSYLKNALMKNIPDQAREYIKRMQIVNEHSRLTFICFMAGKKGDRKEMIGKAKELISFRIKNKDKVDINWNVLFQYQYYQMNDQIGTKYLGFLPEKLNPDEF